MTTLNEYIADNRKGMLLIQKTISIILEVNDELYSSLFKNTRLDIDGTTVDVKYVGGKYAGSFNITAESSNINRVEVLLVKEEGKFVGYIISDNPYLVIQSRTDEFDWVTID